MCFRSRSLASVVLLTLLVTPTSRADDIVGKHHKTYGHIVAMSSTAVVIVEGCNGNRRTFAWDDIKYLEINDRCGGDQLVVSISPITVCRQGDTFVALFDVQFDGFSSFFADISLGADSSLRLVVPSGRDTISGPLRDATAIQREGTCSSAITDTASFRWPPSFHRLQHPTPSKGSSGKAPGNVHGQP